MSRLIADLPLKLADEQTERVRRRHAEQIAELQSLPFAAARKIAVTLVDGIATAVNHGLGREPKFIVPSVIRGAVSAGYIVETLVGDRAQQVTLTANGYGATITLDLMAM